MPDIYPYYWKMAGLEMSLEEMTDDMLCAERDRLEDIMDSPEEDYEYLMSLQDIYKEMKKRGL